MSSPTDTLAVTEHWRPRDHFTPQRNWINDPNGLVYLEGEYHLFYQYNPFGKQWGHMSWGHAVSTDLLHWEELPVAIPEREFMIFSGCAVVDWQNSSGLGDGTAPPLVALYTAFHQEADRQAQHLAYSHDRGRTWIDHPANPVIDRDMAHFRDPKVFWHEASGAWIMVVALPRLHQVAIYRSADLLDWQLASEWGPFGHVSGQWECPDLIELPVEGSGTTVWMMKVDVDKDVIGSVNGAQVFFGRFDGHSFVAEDEAGLLADHGADFYAAQSWSDLPAGSPPIWLAWMSNHQSGHQYPTDPWRGAMTLPRMLAARRRAGGWQLVQRPVSVDRDAGEAHIVHLAPDAPHRLAANLSGLCGSVAFTCTVHDRLVISIGTVEAAAVEVEFDGGSRTVTLRRIAQGWAAPDAFAEPMSARWAGDDVAVELRLDRCSVEVFIPTEGMTLTACFFAPPDAATTWQAQRSEMVLRVSGFGSL